MKLPNLKKSLSPADVSEIVELLSMLTKQSKASWKARRMSGQSSEGRFLFSTELELDSGSSFATGLIRFSIQSFHEGLKLTVRNLGDHRHVVSYSEVVLDAPLYVFYRELVENRAHGEHRRVGPDIANALRALINSGDEIDNGPAPLDG